MRQNSISSSCQCHFMVHSHGQIVCMMWIFYLVISSDNTIQAVPSELRNASWIMSFFICQPFTISGCFKLRRGHISSHLIYIFLTIFWLEFSFQGRCSYLHRCSGQLFIEVIFVHPFEILDVGSLQSYYLKHLRFFDLYNRVNAMIVKAETTSVCLCCHVTLKLWFTVTCECRHLFFVNFGTGIFLGGG